ncbi:helix-turn-helix domain-containing protein [Ruegeria sp.]|uniref:helix-turn-helix domain-containing protein n=1 Tax=Ruegeria sp. TaxID=1879320 RepID=UPI003B58F91B
MIALTEFRALRHALASATALSGEGSQEACARAVSHLRRAMRAAETLEERGTFDVLEGILGATRKSGERRAYPGYRNAARAALAGLINGKDLPALPATAESLEDIIQQTADVSGLEAQDLRCAGREREICTARHNAMLLMAALTDASLAQIGAALGRSHTTARTDICHAAGRVASNPAHASLIVAVLRRLDPADGRAA